MQDKLKSILCINGNDPKALLNSTLYGADALVLDLDEAVGDADRDQARILVQEALQFLDFSGHTVTVRVNRMCGQGGEDIAVVCKGKPDAIIIPRARAASVEKADAAIAAAEKEYGLGAGSIKLWLTIETVDGLEAVSDLVKQCPRVAGVIFNATNFLKDLGQAESGDPAQLAYARSRVAIAARAAGIPAYDRPYYDVKNRDGFVADAKLGLSFGYVGKLAVSGGQVPQINELFA